MNKVSPSLFFRQTMISTISRDSEGTMTKSRRNELEDLRYGLSNPEALKIKHIMHEFDLKSKKNTREVGFRILAGFLRALISKISDPSVIPADSFYLQQNTVSTP